MLRDRMQGLTPLAKGMIGAIGVGSLWAAVYTYGPKGSHARDETPAAEPALNARAEALTPAASASNAAIPAGTGAAAKAVQKASAAPPPYTTLDNRPVRIGL